MFNHDSKSRLRYDSNYLLDNGRPALNNCLRGNFRSVRTLVRWQILNGRRCFLGDGLWIVDVLIGR
jgi:hypothetical protein